MATADASSRAGTGAQCSATTGRGAAATATRRISPAPSAAGSSVGRRRVGQRRSRDAGAAGLDAAVFPPLSSVGAARGRRSAVPAVRWWLPTGWCAAGARHRRGRWGPLARTHNVRGAFALRRGHRITGRQLVLMGDVLITGAADEEWMRVLCRAGAAYVVAMVQAQVFKAAVMPGWAPRRPSRLALRAPRHEHSFRATCQRETLLLRRAAGGSRRTQTSSAAPA